MEIIKVKHPDDGYWEDCALGDYDRARIDGEDSEIFIYYYGTGSWEGNGEAIQLKGGLWYRHNLGHCSCYGPCESLEYARGHKTLKALEDVVTEEAYNDLAPLFKKARKLGYT